MFQNVNVAKSAPFALLTIYQKSLYPPKVFKIAPISANYAKFAHFVNLFYIMFQAPAPAENPGKFQRITQIPHDSPTQPTNHANSAHFAL